MEYFLKGKIMGSIKKQILEKLCYTELVYGRINKKLNLDLSNNQIEKLIVDVLQEGPEENYYKNGKNYYVTNSKRKIRVTINSYTFRVVTVDRVEL
jgi:hypothetical protein